MRSIHLWAYHADFGTLCRNAQVDNMRNTAYPSGNVSGQAGWHVAFRFSNLAGLASALQQGIAMPRQFCGNWISDCEPIKRGEISHLAICAHGDQGGVLLVNGKENSSKLTPLTVETFQKDLNTIGLYTRSGSTILLMGCLAGQGEPGTRLLNELSRIWPGRTVVGFSTIGYRHPGEMKRPGEACEYPGMRDTDATDYLYRDPPRWDRSWSDFKTLPWASETSTHAKVVLDGLVRKWPAGESAARAVPAQRLPAHRPGIPLRRH